jgi:hypothetical protein
VRRYRDLSRKALRLIVLFSKSKPSAQSECLEEPTII